MHQISKIYFVTKLCMFRATSVPVIRSYQLYTWQLVRFMQVMWPLPKTIRFKPDSLRQRPHNLHETYHLPSLQLITPENLHVSSFFCAHHQELSVMWPL